MSERTVKTVCHVPESINRQLMSEAYSIGSTKADHLVTILKERYDGNRQKDEQKDRKPKTRCKR